MILGERIRIFQMSTSIFHYGLTPYELAIYSYLVSCAGNRSACQARIPVSGWFSGKWFIHDALSKQPLCNCFRCYPPGTTFSCCFIYNHNAVSFRLSLLAKSVSYSSYHSVSVIYGKNYTPVMHPSNPNAVYNKGILER